MSEAKFRLLGSTAPQRAACAHAKQQTQGKGLRRSSRRSSTMSASICSTKRSLILKKTRQRASMA